MPKPRQPQKIKIDPIFVIPPGAEDLFVYSRDGIDLNDDVNTTDVNVEIFGIGLDDDEINDQENTDDTLSAPDNFYIISQTVERSDGGGMVVDVVLGTDDVPGATNYEVQVIKQ